MADIDVERKGRSIWPWILGVLLLALLIWAFLELFGDDEAEVAEQDAIVAPVAQPATPAPPDAGAPPEVTMYLAQCTNQQGTAAGEMGLGHQFTTDCLRQLRAGLSALIGTQQVQDANVSAQLAQYDSTVQQLEQSDTTASTHAGLTRDAAGTAAEVMQSMQQAWYSAEEEAGDAVSEVQDAVDDIDASEPMLEQREDVHEFFREAGEALQTLAQPQGTTGATGF